MSMNNVESAGAAFFSPAANIKPYLKVAAQGFAGTGKTFTLAQIACELVKRRKLLDPATPMRVAMIDTEKSSGFLRRVFGAAGIELVVKETRSLKDVVDAINLCESGYAPVLLLDSLTHVYENFVEAYKTERKRTRLEMLDWGVLKPRWKDTFSARFVRSRADILFTGRAGYEYDTNEVTLDNGKKKLEIYKSGVKMKVDGETAYEPDIVLHMDRVEELLEDDKLVYRTCTVLKDRSGLIDGKTLRNPTGAEFAPVFDYLLTSPAAVVADEPEGNDRSLFHDDDETERRKLHREILLEKIEETIRKAAPGQTTAEKTLRQGLLEQCFGTLSWREVTVSDLAHLNAGLVKLNARLETLRGRKVEADAEGKPFAADGNGDGHEPSPAAPAKKAPRAKKEEAATDGDAAGGAEVEAIQPLDQVTKARMVESLMKLLGARGMGAKQINQHLTDETGRAIQYVSDLTDDEVRRLHAKASEAVTA